MTGPVPRDPMGAIRQFVDAFNSGDVAGAEAARADETSTTFRRTRGSAAAMTTWFTDRARLSAEFGMSDSRVTLKEPRHVVITDHDAYVLVPMGVRWLDHGAPQERGGTITVALREGAEGWRITALAWTWD
jgi:hypothetical protein